MRRRGCCCDEEGKYVGVIRRRGCYCDEGERMLL
jgi:hypothetical protein